MVKALFPGSFDPIHLGHIDIALRAAKYFDELVVAVVGNPQKNTGAFTIEQRVELAESSLASHQNISVLSYNGLVVDLAKDIGAEVIVKGVRSIADFEVERQMAELNQNMTRIDTFLLVTNPLYGAVASRYIREIARLGGEIAPMVSAPVLDAIQKRFA